MVKYRITENITWSGVKVSRQFNIERKSFWGWKRIKIQENNKETKLCFNEFIEAELYLISKYCPNQGNIYKPYPNEYHYQEYYMYY